MEIFALQKKALRHRGRRAHDIHYTGRNTSCGDELTYFVKLDGSRVADVSFEPEGCAVSTVFAYLLAEKARGRSVSELLEMSEEDYFRLVGMQVSPGRVKCALLPLVTLKGALRLI